MQGLFNNCQIDECYPAYQQAKQKNHMITSIDVENSFDKIQLQCKIKQSRNKRNLFNLIKISMRD